MINANPKSIELYVLVDGNEVPFYGRSYAEFVLSNGDTFVTKDGFVFNVVHSNEQVKVGSFRYDAKRMGGAPIITFTLMYDECLDKLWSDQVYAKFRGERYFLKQTPTSSKSNDDARYKHDVELIAERTILDNAYFYDAVVGSPIENDVPVTNSTKFNFYGHIEKFVERMNASLQYTGIQKVDEDGNVVSGYHVVLDDDVVKRDQKQVSFDSAVFSQALQESYNTFGIPFYFDGQTIHIGFSNNIIEDVLEYGVDGALLSATKTNANFKVVNRATGDGSSDNLTYYYPNNSPKGEIGAEVNTSSEDFKVKIIDHDLYAEKIKLDEVLVNTNVSYDNLRLTYDFRYDTVGEVDYFSGQQVTIKTTTGNTGQQHFYIRFNAKSVGVLPLKITSTIYSSVTEKDKPATLEQRWQILSYRYNSKYPLYNDPTRYDSQMMPNGTEFLIPITEVGEYIIHADWRLISPDYAGWVTSQVSVEFEYGTPEGWSLNGGAISLEDVGLEAIGTPQLGDTITQRLIKKVNTSSTLQPSIYRATDGKERFYNAINYPFAYEEGYELKYGEYLLDGEVHNDAYKKDDGTYYEFTNEYKEGRPREHVFTVDDIKPTIKEATNGISWIEQDDEGNNRAVFQRIDMFSEFAYNIGDNDETYTDPNGNTSLKHPYFFGKLRKLDFNLFECANELGEMTFSMTSGNCGACNFKIGVSEDYPQFNTVQVDANGNLMYDENGYVLCGLEDFQGEVQPQDRQQDTVNYEVWVALKKEEDTYGILMPKAPVDGVGGHRPVACSSENANDGDTFVILNINLPDEYVYRAEKKLEKAIVKYIWENNVEKFNFSVNFSRIFLEENPDVLNALNENARLTRVKYNGDEYVLYVSSYSYSMNEGEVLPEIRIELDDTLTIAQNSLQQAIDGVKSDIAGAINAIDVAAIGSRYFLRKDVADVAEAPINFKGGLYFNEGGHVSYLNDGSAKLTIDHLEVRKKATFTSLEIQEQSHVGGQVLITPASMVCSEVEELEDAYRCYFESYGENGEAIFNQFVAGDQAISQTFNEWGGHYYWRLVAGVGEDYIDLSKTDCAADSDVPKAGDKIIQLGNRSNTARQAAQVLSSYGENAPSFIMYNGIDSFSLEGKNVTGILWNPEKQEPQMYSYGDFFFGDRNLESNFITFQKKEGEEEKKLHINADITIGANSSGLTNLSEWSSFEASLEQTITDINNKLDGVVENYFDDYVPTKNNEPAATWISDGTEADHIGDTFTNTSLEGDGAGKSWRWLQQDDGSYDWQQIADTDAVKALLAAAQAQETANSKRRNFIIQPYTPYDEGDMWMQGENGGILICVKGRQSGSFVQQDWALASKYTDDTRANEAIEGLTKKANITDVEHLTRTFAKTVDVEGVVMSKMVAVKEGNNIEAFLNGSDFAEDTSEKNCGKLILAAGIPSDGGTLEERAREATTRIYEDGCTYTKNMHLQDGCTIGNAIKVTEDGIEIDNPSVNGKSYFNEDGMRATGTLYVDAPYDVRYGQCGAYAQEICVGNYTLLCHEFHKDNDGTKEKMPVGTFYEVPDGYCVAARDGMFAGLRPNMRRITAESKASHCDLTEYDHTIIAEVDCPLYLPANPKEGQRYEIIKLYNAVVEIYSSGVQVYSGPSYGGNNGYGTNVTRMGSGAFLKATYIYTGSYWIRMIESYS